MSGFTNVTGFAAPTSLAGFLSGLQMASFRGVPFKVQAARVKKGRRWAVHEYPYVDGGWPEDMGRALRTYSFSGYLIGDAAPVMQLLLDNAIETKGPGLLMHPTIGALQVGLLSSSTAVQWDKLRVIQIEFEFIEVGSSIFPLMIIATVISVLAAADSALTATGTSFAAVATPAAVIGPPVLVESQTVASSFAAAVTAGGANPTAIISMAAALPPPDSNTTYGRYGAGSASVMLPIGTTVASLQAQLANQRAALALAAADAAATAGAYSASTDMLAALAALVEAMRAGITDPGAQVRVLLGLAGFTFVDGAAGAVGVGAAMAAMRDAMAAACRRAALISLARASAAYQPVSYEDAAALRVVMSAALDAEITTAGDAGDDAAYGALKTLRSAVVQDLTARGASLPTVVTVALGLPMPALAIAQRLYRDASRSDEIAAESGAPHPAFCPISFQVLTSGLGANVNPTIPAVMAPSAANAGGVLIAPQSVSGPYHAPPPPALPPGAPVGLAINEPATTRTSITLTWSPPTLGSSPVTYTVQVGAVDPATGVADSFADAISVGVPLTTATVSGLATSTFYDFQVYATNGNGQGAVSGIVATSTHAYGPYPPAGLGAEAGTPAETVMVLTWTAPPIDGSHDAATAYTAYYRPTGASSFLYASPGWTSGTSAMVTGLTAGTSYDFEVVATNWGGGAVTAVLTAVTFARTPNAATGLTAVAGSPAVSVAGLSWTASAVDGTHDAPATYTPQYQVAPSGTWTTFGAPIAGTSVSVTGLAHGTAYNFQVIATNSGGTATTATASLTTATAAPNAVTGLTAGAGSPAVSVVALSWTASAVDGTHDAAVTYTPQYELVSGGGWTTFGSPIAGTSVSITGLAHSTAYNFQVVATNAAGGTTSGSVSATTTGAVPNLPTGLAAGTLLAITTSSIAVSWTASVADGTHDAAVSYTLQYRVTSVGGAWTQITGISGTTQTVTGLASATGYDFQVEGINAGGAGGFTATANGTTFAVAITLNYVSPSPFAHGSYPGVNASTTPIPTNLRAAWGSSATAEPTSGWTAAGNYSAALWGVYLNGGASAAAGTVYLWLEAQTSGGVTTGLSVTGPYTVT
jgi:prophage DNA circulation protein